MSLRSIILPAPLIAGEIQVEGDEARHALSVLRVRVGEGLRVADAAGLEAEAEVLEAGRRMLRLRVAAPRLLPEPHAARLTLAVALPRGDRAADLLRGLCELGIGALLPLRCERAVREDAGLDRLRRVAVESCKQCRRGRPPLIHAPAGLADLTGPLVLLDPAGGPPSPGRPVPTTLVIGPEGGFTTAERALLIAQGAVAVRIASPILRTETAALAAAALWAATWEHAS